LGIDCLESFNELSKRQQIFFGDPYVRYIILSLKRDMKRADLVCPASEAVVFLKKPANKR
jgi:hypothetical protein